MGDPREVKKILSTEIERDRLKGTRRLSKKLYFQKLLNKFGIDKSAKSIAMSLVLHFKLSSQLSPHRAMGVYGSSSIC